MSSQPTTEAPEILTLDAVAASPPRAAPQSRFGRWRAWVDDNGGHPGLLYVPQLAALLVVHVILQKYFLKRCALDEADYFSFFLAPRLLLNPKAVVFFALLGAGLVAARGRLRWSDLEAPAGAADALGRTEPSAEAERPRLRLLIGVIVISAAWAFSLYAPNYYYGRVHGLDRALLVAFAALALAHRPAWLAAFVAQFTMIVMQFEESPVQYSLTDKRILLSIMILFVAFMLLRAASRSFPARLFLIVALAMTAANYFFSGWAKMRLDWWADENLSYIFMAATDNGWMRAAGPGGRETIRAMFDAANPLMLAFTLVVELGALAVFFGRRFAVPMIAAWIALHLGIFFATGIFFWKWIVMDAAFIAIAWRRGFLLRLPGGPGPSNARWSAAWTACVGVALTLASPLFTEVHFLGWIDTPLSAVYRFEAVGRSGKIYEIPPAAFEPYDFPFAQSRFGFLTERKPPVGTYGSSEDRAVARKLLAVREPIGPASWAPAPASTAKEIAKEPKKIRGLEEFLRAYMKWRNERPAPPWAALAAPHHIWTGPVGAPDAEYGGQEPMTAIRVRLTETFFVGSRGVIARDEVVREVRLAE